MYWPVAQLAVQKTVNFEVDSSNLSWPVNSPLTYVWGLFVLL